MTTLSLAMEPEEIIQSFADIAFEYLRAKQQNIIEDFLVSGAFQRDLCIEIGPVKCDTNQTQGDDHLWQVWQNIRMV